jgi:hypothetical protein
MTTRGIIAAGTVLLASVIQSLSIEGLQISVQCPDVILGWPSSSEETYIVQWRPSLSPSTPWVTLTNYLSADSGTNWTVFVDSNRVQCASSDNNGMMMISGGEDSAEASILDVMTAYALRMSQPLVMRADGTGTPLPLGLYWPGFDLSAFIIIDPSTGESVSGAGYTVSQPSLNRAQLDDPQPEDDDPGGGSPPDPGFYQVVRNGAHLVGITNGMTLSGVVAIPVEVGNADGNLVNLTLSEDDSPVSGAAIQTPPFPFPLQLVVDTMQMSNGVHQISASARWDSPGSSTNENDDSYEADSPPVTVNVYNEISFPNWMPSFGELDNSLLIEVQSAHTNADWYIDVYDSQYQYIGTFQGHTYDGSIEVAWDLIGPYDDTHYADSFFAFVVSTVFEDPTTASAAPPLSYRVTDPWSAPGQWVMAVQHAWDNVLLSDQLYAELDGFVRLAQQSGYSVSPPPDADGHAFTLHYDPTGQSSQPTTDWAGFRAALYNSSSRNLVYTGHGGPNGLGHNAANTNRFVSATEIAKVLHTVPPGQTNRHAYRMVIADGCATGKGALVSAFGMVPKEDVPFNYYYYASLRPSAFMGWSSDQYISFAGAGNPDHIHFIQWIEYWMELGYGIKDARNRAGGMADVNPGYVKKGQFKVYGYADLNFWAYNQGG